MEYYQIQIPIFFNNKAFKEKINQILDEKELNRINVKKNKKTIIKNTYHNYLWRADETTIDIYTDGSRKTINGETKAGYSVILYDTENSKMINKEIERINEIQDIYRAECIAIYRAIKITSHKNISVNIYTDCKSAYQAIKKTHNHETIISLNTNSRDVLDAIDNEIFIRDRLNLYTNIEWTTTT